MKNLPVFYCLYLLWTTIANSSVYVVAEFDEKDATHILQAAFAAPYDTVFVPNVGKDWIIRPIVIDASNKTIIFESGVIVTAKKGAFAKGDKLFEIIEQKNLTIIGYGATWRMRKEEYLTGEWRHALNIVRCENINIYGLTIRDSGGDGIKIGRGRGQQPAYSKNIHIRDCILDNNRRQAISVISVDTLLIENCILSNTNGTAPQAGIDFEPNNSDERLRAITIRNVDSYGNKGYGIQFLLPRLNSSSMEISAVIQNCRIWGNSRGGVMVKSIAEGVAGTITFDGCIVHDNLGNSFTIQQKSKLAARVNITNCHIYNSDDYPIHLWGPAVQLGGIRFKDSYIVDNTDRPFLFVQGGSSVFDITGNVIVNNPFGGYMSIGNGSRNVSVQDSIKTDITTFVAIPDMNPRGGYFTTPITLSLSTETESAEIYYTVDGRDPTKNSLKYTAPVTLSQSALLKARAYKDSRKSSIMRATFTLSKDLIAPKPPENLKVPE